MRLIRFGAPGEEKPGLELDGGKRIDVSSHVGDYTPDFFASGELEKLALIENLHDDCPVVSPNTRLGPPVAQPGKLMAIGLNYTRHAIETKNPIPTEPVIFSKAVNSLSGPTDNIPIPPKSQKLDYEVELAIVMKSRGRYLASEEAAKEAIAGFAICNDVSERYFQSECGGQWTKGKSCENFAPFGPALVLADAVPNSAGNLALSTKVNGEIRQQSNTNDMIFPPLYCIWYLSQFMVLEPGDIIITGTPEGVGMGFSPGRFLNKGDVVELEIEGLGIQRQTIG